MCTGSVSGHSGGDSEREIWLKVSACVSTFAPEESPGAEASG